MSKPGYPKDNTLTRNVQNSYTRASDHQTFTGLDSFMEEKSYEDKAGDNTPGWPNAPLVSNYYVRSRFKWRTTPLVVDGSVTNGDTFQGEWGNTFDGSYYPLADPILNEEEALGELEDMLTYKLISNVQNNRVNLGEIYHTRQQAADMIGDAAAKIAGAFSQLKRGNPKAAVQQLIGGSGWPPPRNSPFGRVHRNGGGIPQQWLALRYGWLPLVQDTYNSVEVVKRAWDRKGNWYTAKASASVQLPKVAWTRNSAYSHGPILQYESTRFLRGSAKIVYGVGDSGLSSLSSLGITNPASLAWELLPYSFVVDWFLPIGQFISSLDYTLGLFFKYGYRTYKSNATVTSRVQTSHVVSGDITANWSGGSGKGDIMVLQRQRYEAFPCPPPPVLKNPFSPTHMANGLSLLVNAFR
jgi:hypothetical protein